MPKRTHADVGSVHVETALGGEGGQAEAGKCPQCGAKLEEGKGHRCGSAAPLTHATETLTAVEIFDVGTWNGMENSNRDLDDLVQAHEEIGHLIKPRVKLGHAEKQGLLQEGGYPAAGWITKLYRSGTKLLADLVGVPRVIAQLVRAGAYRRVSAEIYHDLQEEATGKTFRRVLDAVAFLGEEMPAVTTLADIVALGYSATQAPIVHVYEREETTPMKTCHKCKKPHEQMTTFEGKDCCPDCKKTLEGPKEHATTNPPAPAVPPAVPPAAPESVSIPKTEYSSLMARVQALEESNKASRDRADRLETALSLYEREDRREKVEAAVDKAVEDGRLLPANREDALAVFAALSDKKVVKYSRDGQEAEASPREIFEGFLSRLPKGIHQKETLRNVDGASVKIRQGADEASSVLDARAQRYSAEHKVSYKEALIAVAKMDQ